MGAGAMRCRGAIRRRIPLLVPVSMVMPQIVPLPGLSVAVDAAAKAVSLIGLSRRADFRMGRSWRNVAGWTRRGWHGW